MHDDQIKYMVNRFLGWKLPKDFNPDCGISFKKEGDYVHPEFGRTKYEPIGTNLFTATQAEAMIRYLLADMPEIPLEEETGWLIEGHSTFVGQSYLATNGKEFFWTTDSLMALRFSREQDAQIIATVSKLPIERIAEHSWIHTRRG